MIIRLNAGNDKNGNPRRVFVVFDDKGEIVKAVNEGYAGRAALTEAGITEQWSGYTFMTTPGEYRDLIKGKF